MYFYRREKKLPHISLLLFGVNLIAELAFNDVYVSLYVYTSILKDVQESNELDL
jgi:hypothetical protein